MNEIPPEFDINNYNFEVPERQVAQYPSDSREKSRLMVVSRYRKKITHDLFENIVNYLHPGSLIVINETKVIPARLKGQKPQTGGRAEFLLTTPVNLIEEIQSPGRWKQALVSGLIKPIRRLKEKHYLQFGPDLYLEVIEKQNFGQILARLYWLGDLNSLLWQYGHIPLPPYIKRDDCQVDRNRYQTVYAREEQAGSVAAPTAGLHFSPELLQKLKNKGIEQARISLMVGYGTFSPIRSRDIRNHHMHSEYYQISEQEAQKISLAKEQKRPIVAVGTTTVRTLETVAQKFGQIRPDADWSDLYIYPGYSFQVVDHLITNFHLPGSSLILMVSAFSGKEFVFQAYQTAINNDYRFFSYGDCMLIL